jgi:ribosomal protein S6--L-glutamate ligase
LLIKSVKLGVVGLPGKWSTETLADAVEEKTGFRLIIDMAKVRLDLATMKLMYEGTDITELDGLLVKKISGKYSPNTIDRLELLRVAEAKGVRVFSPADSMIRLIDRLSCTVTMRNAGIHMPETSITEDIDEAVATVKQYGTAILKPLFSTKARGMEVLDSSHLSDKKLRSLIEAFNADNPMMYIQQKQDLQGQDLGLVFLGGEYIGTYARVANGDAWNTTIHSGGKYDCFEPSAEIIEMAKRAQDLFNMDYTTVDVAQTENGPVVFEVSAFGGFRGVKEGCGIDAASLYVDYALKTLSE